MNLNPIRLALVCICVFGISGCFFPAVEKPYTPVYAFQDGGLYRVEAKYVFTHQLDKKHRGKSFALQNDGVNVQAAFKLRTQVNQNRSVHIEYILSNISIHDQKGNYRIEMGPLSGRLYWFGQEETLESYLGEEGFKTYLSLIGKPLAVIDIDARGVQLEDPTRSEFNFAMIKLLGKNRVIGQVVVKSFKIPPVLVAILPEHALARKGQQWEYQSPDATRFTEWDKPLATRFKFQGVKESLLDLVFTSELKLSSQELAELGKRLGLPETEKMEFGTGLFSVAGEVAYNAAVNRPESGKMQIRKQYSLKLGEEHWDLLELEQYVFSVHVGD